MNKSVPLFVDNGYLIVFGKVDVYSTVSFISFVRAYSVVKIIALSLVLLISRLGGDEFLVLVAWVIDNVLPERIKKQISDYSRMCYW